MIKKSRQTLKYLENKKRLKSETKSTCHHFSFFIIVIKGFQLPKIASNLRVCQTHSHNMQKMLNSTE